MEEALITEITSYLTAGWVWIQQNILDPERLLELAIVLFAVLVSHISCRWIHTSVLRVYGDHELIQKMDRRFMHPLMTALMSILLIWTADLLLTPVLGTLYVLDISVSLFSAWIVIRIAAAMLANRELARIIATLAWTMAALNILGLLTPLSEVLDSAKLPLGDAEVSALDVLMGIFSLALLIWIATLLSSLIDRQLKSLSSVPPSVRVLIGKTSRIMLIALAFLLALNATGIDLTALAVFGGALGVGIGFGLQKVVGNFISGIILLIDRSIKPGDVIETDGTYGTINKLAARYTSVITRDGTEYLIPNEDMITQPVTNWSHSHRLVRRRVPVQVSYGSDIRKAMELMVEAAQEEQRILRDPAPRTLLRGFGDNGVDLELRMWINDPQNGVSNVASAVMLRIWDKFTENKIEFPFPQQVVHLKRG